MYKKTKTHFSHILQMSSCIQSGTHTQSVVAPILFSKLLLWTCQNRFAAQGAFHIFDNKVILETVGPNGEPVPSGQPGKILVSLLGNYGFPLIRYEIGDVGVRSGKSCDCGLPLAVLDRVEGCNTEFC
jgi:phenylacetate-coenzyme A ligase PaaK-like adenylate-forming protein